MCCLRTSGVAHAAEEPENIADYCCSWPWWPAAIHRMPLVIKVAGCRESTSWFVHNKKLSFVIKVASHRTEFTVVIRCRF